MGDNKTGVVLISGSKDPLELADAVKRLGGYQAVAVGELVEGPGWQATRQVEAAVDRVISHGVERVLLIPTLTADFDQRSSTMLEELLGKLQTAHPMVEFLIVPPALDAEHHAHELVRSLQKAADDGTEEGTVPLCMIPTHQGGTIHRLKGGHDFVSRLAALGLIPGSPVQIIQNFGIGSLIISVRGAHLALGREEARKVRVRPAKEKGGWLPHHRGRKRWPHGKRGHRG